MIPFLAVCVPSIRQELVCDLYDSLEKYTTVPWCFSVVSPYSIPDKLKRKGNVIWGQSYRSPAACQAMAVEQCDSNFITYLADDSVVLEKYWTEYTNQLSIIDDWKTCYLAFYAEGGDFNRGDSYFRLNNAVPRSPYLSDDLYLYNVSTVNRDWYHHIGGFSCNFETTFWCHTDFGIRSQLLGGINKVYSYNVASCEWEPGRTASHWAVNDVHIGVDEPLYREMYCSRSINIEEIQQNIKNWRSTTERWYRFT